MCNFTEEINNQQTVLRNCSHKEPRKNDKSSSSMVPGLREMRSRGMHHGKINKVVWKYLCSFINLQPYKVWVEDWTWTWQGPSPKFAVGCTHLWPQAGKQSINIPDQRWQADNHLHKLVTKTISFHTEHLSVGIYSISEIWSKKYGTFYPLSVLPNMRSEETGLE